MWVGNVKVVINVCKLLTKVLYKESKRECREGVVLYLLCTSEEKSRREGSVNSGLTTSCTGSVGEILIYRKEEFLKVLVHELIHRAGLEWSHQTNTPSFESYVEYWAERITLALFALQHNKDIDWYRNAWNTEKFHTQQRIEVLRHTQLDDPRAPVQEYFHRKAIMMGAPPLTHAQRLHAQHHIHDLRMMHHELLPTNTPTKTT